MKVTVDKARGKLLRDGNDFFWLADTVWSAFTNISMTEWENYLRLRKRQGMNVLQINILPQWDRCLVTNDCWPFPTADGQVFNYTALQDAYFQRAAKMLEMALKLNFTPALVVLWGNFVPGTWETTLITDCNVMPKSFLRPYAEKVCQTFDRFEPVYIISGDTDFDTPEAAAYYEEMLDLLQELSPETLKTAHIKGRYSKLPPKLAKELDFYLYQSGHNPAAEGCPYQLAEEFRRQYTHKPLINSEPCYEGMGYGKNAVERFSERDVRRAAWQSVLSGADAGITYGANGIWNWYKTGMPVNPTTGEAFFGTPADAGLALHLPGAEDYGYLAQFLLAEGNPQLTPCQEIMEDESPEIRAARCADGKVLIYLPSMHMLSVKLVKEPDRILVIDLATRYIYQPEHTYKDNILRLDLRGYREDLLVVLA